MEFAEKTCAQFVDELSTNAPVPGGGGAAALMAAIGTALGSMVGALTVGKPKYAAVEDELVALCAHCTQLRARFLALIDKDAQCFAPLAAAYRIDKAAPGRADALEAATKNACTAPVELMTLCCEAIDCIAVFAEKGARLAVSDAGCAAVCCKAALQSAALNLFINTKALHERTLAQTLNETAEAQLETYCKKADDIYAQISTALRG